MSMNFQDLELEIQGQVATVWLNRPAVRNALDEVLISEITQAINHLERDDAVRVLVLAGRGKAFCAGADLNWMKRMAGYSAEQNQTDAMGLATMLKTLKQVAKPTIARVHGAAYAGGMGLASACDVVVAEPTAEFCLSEVRIGLIPATISPYVIQALGIQAAKRYMLTAERISAKEAHRLGFVQELCEDGAIDAAIAQIDAMTCARIAQGGGQPTGIHLASGDQQRLLAPGECRLASRHFRPIEVFPRHALLGEEGAFSREFGVVAGVDQRQQSAIHAQVD